MLYSPTTFHARLDLFAQGRGECGQFRIHRRKSGVKRDTVVRAICLLIMMVPLFAGCVALPWNDPHDLAYAAVSVVDWYDYPDKPSNVSFSSEHRSHRPKLKIDFTTDANLFTLTESNDYRIYDTSALCKRSMSPWIILSGPYIYWMGHDVSNFGHGHYPDGIEFARGPFTYYILTDITWMDRGINDDLPPHPAYDFRKNAEDICFNISAHQTFSIPFTTNTVVVPKEAIAAALNAAPWVDHWKYSN
jgi:hypothetical protein